MNLGTGRGASVREIIDACRRVTGHAIPTVVGAAAPATHPNWSPTRDVRKSVLDWTAEIHDDRVDRRDGLAVAQGEPAMVTEIELSS